MNVLWLTWKDRTHPLAGGAELVNEELAKRLVKDGNQVIFLVGGYDKAKQKIKHKDGYEIIRLGNRFSVYWQVYKYYKQHLIGWADLVIDEMNTIPFFAKYYVQEKNVMFVHQLCRQIWFYEMFFPLNIVGYLLEPIYLRMLSDRHVITISDSTKKDLEKFGFKPENIHIIPEGLEHKALNRLPSLNFKAKTPTILSFGAMRSMKKTIDQIRAFELAKEKVPNLKLEIAGQTDSKYGKRVLRAISNSKFSKDIKVHGKVSQAKKLKLMQQCDALIVTSVKEGWCLVITEAASMGTLAIAYDSDGLRDSIKQKKTGILTSNNVQSLALAIESLFPKKKEYTLMRENAWQWSKKLTLDNSYEAFNKSIRSIG